MTLDGPHPKGGTSIVRAAAANTTYLTQLVLLKAIGLVIPELNGKLDSAAQRVPCKLTGSLTELVTVLDKEVTVDEVNAVMEKSC